MRKSIALIAAALFVTTNLAPAAFAAEKAADKKPTADECKKDPKMKGCEAEKAKK